MIYSQSEKSENERQGLMMKLLPCLILLLCLVRGQRIQVVGEAIDVQWPTSRQAFCHLTLASSGPYKGRLAIDHGESACSLSFQAIHQPHNVSWEPVLELVSLDTPLNVGTLFGLSSAFSAPGKNQTLSEEMIDVVLWTNVTADLISMPSQLEALFRVKDSSGRYKAADAKIVVSTRRGVLQMMQSLVTKYGHEGAGGLHAQEFEMLFNTTFAEASPAGDTHDDHNDEGHDHRDASHHVQRAKKNARDDHEHGHDDEHDDHDSEHNSTTGDGHDDHAHGGGAVCSGTAKSIFERHDVSQDQSLDVAELVGPATQLLLMLTRACAPTGVAAPETGHDGHDHRRVHIEAVLTTDSQRWGYAFLSWIVCMAAPLIAMLILFVLRDEAMSKVAQFLGLPLTFGACVGVSMLLYFPVILRINPMANHYGLDGPTSVTRYFYDFLFPIILAAAASMVCYVLEKALHAWHETPAESSGPVDVQVHDDLNGWDTVPQLEQETVIPVPGSKKHARTVHASAWGMLAVAGFVNLTSSIFGGAAWTTTATVGLYVWVGIGVYQLMLQVGAFITCVNGGLSKIASFLWLLAMNSMGLIGLIAGVAGGSPATAASRYLMGWCFGLMFYVSLSLVGTEMIKQQTWTRFWVQGPVVCVTLFVTLVLSKWGPYTA